MCIEDLVQRLKDSEANLEENKLKTEYFANLSHELKTPLNIILGSMQLIELHMLNGRIQDSENILEKYINNMKQNALRLLRLINNIIDLTKIDANELYVEFHNYDIVDIVKNVAKSIESYARIKSVNINFYSQIESQVIACDADKIERILLNLLSNALKFTNENGNIDISIKKIAEKISICVEDDGIGIHKEKLKTVFKRFRKVDKSFTRNRQGSGIGLSIVKSLVELHNGTISAESEYGKGSRFIIQLPSIMLDEENNVNLYSKFQDGIIERVRVEFSDL
ncbi:HAMP domain-containing histidine kinase [Clostridium sp. YIM B02515]|uniref:histidine kinase n=2 Tax=Clostridium rhizosphaerae TaxID=2803861 RepID=A0ABS1T874_9CLOT|nr:HAMP domain-containing histidine kinase [Clostridium rhizosphaerae]